MIGLSRDHPEGDFDLGEEGVLDAVLLKVRLGAKHQRVLLRIFSFVTGSVGRVEIYWLSLYGAPSLDAPVGVGSSVRERDDIGPATKTDVDVASWTACVRLSVTRHHCPTLSILSTLSVHFVHFVQILDPRRYSQADLRDRILFTHRVLGRGIDLRRQGG